MDDRIQFMILIVYNFTMQYKLPHQLTYQRIYPKGFPSVFKQWINDPLTGNKTWSHNDIVRFNFLNPKKGTFDPYRSFIQITVSVTDKDLPIGLLQIDNSAHSFIQQMVLYSNNRQVQRITQYGVILAYLNDIGLNQFLSQGRQTQGLGYGSFNTMPFQRNNGSISCQPRRQIRADEVSVGLGISTINPTIGNGFPQQIQYLNQNSIYNCSRGCKAHISNSNPCLTGSDWNGGNGTQSTMTGIQACMNLNGWANNIRTDYLAPFISQKYPEHTQSIPNYELIVTQQTTGNAWPYKYSNSVGANNIYSTDVRDVYNDSLYFDRTHSNEGHTINCANFGFNCLYSPYYNRGTNQPFISPTVSQVMFANGQFLRKKIPISRRKFKIPLASAVIGALIDQSSYCLLPLQSINDCLMQITLDPYAMFTSGFNDKCEVDDVGMQIQQKRCWNIDRIQYKLHTYFFVDSQIQNHIKTSLYKQIVLVSNFWQLANQYQIPGKTPVNNSYIVGCNSANLNQIICLFVSNDYQNYSFCRKHFRNSNNVKQFWSKISTDYWPPQPFKGNGGNPVSNNFDDDNTVFIENLYWANNYMFQKNILPRINIYNFAVNQRPYDVTNKNTLYDPNMIGNQAYCFNSRSVNADTAMGMPFIHENRVVGKAAYIIVYTPFIQQQNLLQGINVSGISNFQVVFDTDSTHTNSRDQTLYIYAKSSVIVKYTSNGIYTIGR